MSEFTRRRRTLQEDPVETRKEILSACLPYCAWCNGRVTVKNLAQCDEDGYLTCLECFEEYAKPGGQYDQVEAREREAALGGQER